MFAAILNFFTRIPLKAEHKKRLLEWQQQKPPAPNTPWIEQRLVVVDVETTGIHIYKDKLIAIGAIAIHNWKIDFSDRFEIFLKQETTSSKKNILLHGIGGQKQQSGVETIEGLLRFLEFVKHDPLIAYNVSFDQTMVDKTLSLHLNIRSQNMWIDLAHILPMLFPTYGHAPRGLDAWLKEMKIENYARHNAVADALATAMLLLTLKQKLIDNKTTTISNLQDMYLRHKRYTT